MSSDTTEDFKKAGLALVKEQVSKIDKYGSFILFAWGMGEIFLYFMQASLAEDPLRKLVVIIGLLYVILFPLVGVFAYAGLNALMNKSKRVT